MQALAQGLPVLLEKPVSTTVAQGQLLLEAVQATGAQRVAVVRAITEAADPAAATRTMLELLR